MDRIVDFNKTIENIQMDPLGSEGVPIEIYNVL